MIVLLVTEDEFQNLESGLDDYGDKEGIMKLRAQLENQNPFQLIQRIAAMAQECGGTYGAAYRAIAAICSDRLL